ncbi:hypothetical protein Poly30_26640 [Planctomycetes bacterium Poly30]|uniref:Putative auto-transporter adhesin head GIN domain-containing protein n=1 Tax=Saltatorellus ferox TaxID=2528018 RepID=A0A518ESV4_9BACT|nr:hypothetical protein Poly30_26640 [Planctomycetes bacterium Poly30]
MTYPRSRILKALALSSLGGAALGGLTACPGGGPTVIRGSGPVVQEQRTFRPIERIELRGRVDLSVLVLPSEEGALLESTGPETVVFLEGASDLLSWVETTLDGTTLTLRFRDDVRLDPLPSIEVQTARLLGISSVGSGDVRLSGVTSFATRGSALSIAMTGSGDLAAEGAVDTLEVRHVGSGDLDLRHLRSRTASYSGLGSGDAWVHVKDSLRSRLTGTGDLYLLGDVPDERVDSETIGSAELRRERDR